MESKPVCYFCVKPCEDNSSCSDRYMAVQGYYKYPDKKNMSKITTITKPGFSEDEDGIIVLNCCDKCFDDRELNLHPTIRLNRRIFIIDLISRED